MRKILVTIIFSVIFLISNAQKMTFQGKINGMDSTEINVLIIPLERKIPIFDKIQCKQGKFEYKANFELDSWNLVRLSSDKFNSAFDVEKSISQKLKNQEIVFFIRPHDKISIVARIGDLGINYKVSGNDISAQRTLISKKRFLLEEEFNRLTILKEKNKNETEEFQRLKNELVHITQRIDSLELKTIAMHPDWEYSAELLPNYPLDTIAKYYKKFTTDVKNSFFGTYISRTLLASEIGKPAPVFTLNDNNGKKVSLNDFVGKYVVLDFWGTWCSACLKGMPKMKDYFSKYQDKVEFISINCQDNQDVWLKAIRKYDLDWINLFSEDDEITEEYGIDVFPTKMIIDTDGKIVLKMRGEDETFYTKMDELFEK